MDVKFSTRLENIVTITNAFVAKGKDSSEARDEAKFMEAEIRKNSKSIDEYQQLCDELCLAMAPPEVVVPEPMVGDEILNHDGPSFGDYSYATFHRDGQMSTLFKAKSNREGTLVPIVALKVTVPGQMQPPHNAQKEARILAEVKHIHIVPLLQSFWQQERFILVFPFLRQDLENLLRSNTVTLSQSRMVFESLFAALSHLHSLGVIHRDVKPSNILLRSMDGPVYLADFGIAWSVTDPQSERPDAKITDVGTTSYRPPELLFGDKKYDTTLDMWAAGCVVAELICTGHRPLFDAGPLGSELGLIKSIFTTLGTPTDQTWPSATKLPDWNKVRFQQFEAKDWSEILPGASGQGIDFVRRTVCYESHARLTAAEAMQHPFASTIGRPGCDGCGVAVNDPT